MFTTLGTAAATAVVLVAVGVGSCVPQSTGHPPAAGASTSAAPSTSPSTGATSPSTGPSGSPSTGPVVHTLIPVYYIGTGPALYREFRDVQIPPAYQPAQLKSALSELLHTPPLDPDYVSLWGMTQASFRNITVDSAGVVTIDFDGSLAVTYKGPGKLSTAVYKAGLQQLVWTMTAVRGITGVRIFYQGKPKTDLAAIPSTMEEMATLPEAPVSPAVAVKVPEAPAAAANSGKRKPYGGRSGPNRDQYSKRSQSPDRVAQRTEK